MRNEQIEDVTAQRIRQYEAKTGTTVRLPVPVEEIVEQVLNLTILWEAIDEQPGEMILGGLQRPSLTIVLNEKHMVLFDEKPGLLRSTVGHEAGHWDMEAKSDPALPSLFGGGGTDRHVHRHSAKNNQLIEVLLDLVIHNDKAYRLFKKLTAGQDTAEVRSLVDRYQSALLMPSWLIKEAEQRYDFLKWRDLYRLAEEAQVNITNLTVRLQRLGLIYLRDGDKRIYRSKDEVTGQGSLFR